jgi:hypothetical protein
VRRRGTLIACAPALVAAIASCFDKPPRPGGSSDGPSGDGQSSQPLCTSTMSIDPFQGPNPAMCSGSVTIAGGMLMMQPTSGVTTCEWGISSLFHGVVVDITQVSALGPSGFAATAELELGLAGGSIVDVNLTATAITSTTAVSSTAAPSGMLINMTNRVWLLVDAPDDHTVAYKAAVASDLQSAQWDDLGTETFPPGTTTQSATVTVGVRASGTTGGSASAIFTDLDTCR